MAMSIPQMRAIAASNIAGMSSGERVGNNQFGPAPGKGTASRPETGNESNERFKNPGKPGLPSAEQERRSTERAKARPIPSGGTGPKVSGGESSGHRTTRAGEQTV